MSARISGDSSSAATSADAERGATFREAKEPQLRGPDPRLFAQRGGRFSLSRKEKPTPLTGRNRPWHGRFGGFVTTPPARSQPHSKPSGTTHLRPGCTRI